jgi:hypothetical protein
MFEKYEGGRLIIPKEYFGYDESSLMIVEDFIEKEDLETLNNYAKSIDVEYEGGHRVELKNRIHTPEAFYESNPKLYDLIKNKYLTKGKALIENKHKLKLSESYRCGDHTPKMIEGEPRKKFMEIVSRCGCFVESIPTINVWREGNDQREHFDNNEFSALVYINDDYIGGEINFPEIDLSIKPKAGSLIVWPGYFKHSVSLVVSGTRFTLPMFLKAISVIES